MGFKFLESYTLPVKNSGFSKNEKFCLWAITLLAAFLRIYYQYDREFYGDEVGTIILAEKSISYLLSNFTSWLTMNYFIVLEKFLATIFGRNPVGLASVSLLAGICLVPLTASLSIRLTTSRVAVIAAGLVALNPYLIQYSGIIRSYSLLSALSVTAIIFYLKWQACPTIQNGALFATACFFLMLCHLNGTYTIAFLTILLGLHVLTHATKSRLLVVIKTLAIPLLVSMLLFFISHIKIFPEIIKLGSRWHDTPPTSISYMPHVFFDYFGKGYFGSLSLIFLIMGVWITWKRKLFLFFMTLAIIVPVVLMSAQGLSHFSWAYGRFLIFCIPVLVIFIAEGLNLLVTSLVPRRKQLLGVLVLSAILCATWMPNMKRMFFYKRSISDSFFSQAADIVKKGYKQNDLILCLGWYAKVQFQLYLPKDKYDFITVEAFFNSDDPAGSGRNVFLLSPSDIESSFPQYNVTGGTVIRYPGGAKRQVLTRIKNDYIKGIDRSKLYIFNAQKYSTICQINRYFGTENDDDYCDLWNKRPKGSASPWGPDKRMKNIFRK